MSFSSKEATLTHEASKILGTHRWAKGWRHFFLPYSKTSTLLTEPPPRLLLEGEGWGVCVADFANDIINATQLSSSHDGIAVGVHAVNLVISQDSVRLTSTWNYHHQSCHHCLPGVLTTMMWHSMCQAPRASIHHKYALPESITSSPHHLPGSIPTMLSSSPPNNPHSHSSSSRIHQNHAVLISQEPLPTMVFSSPW